MIMMPYDCPWSSLQLTGQADFWHPTGTIGAAIITAIKDAGYLHVPEGRRDHSTPAETLRLHGLD